MSEERDGGWGCWLSVPAAAVAAIAWLLSKIHQGGSCCFADKNNRWSFMFALLWGPCHHTRGPREFALLGRLLFVCVHAYLNRNFVFGFYKLANEFNDKRIDFLRCLQDMLVLKWLLIKFSSTHPQFSAVLLQNKLLTTGGRAWMQLTKKSLPAANPNKHGPFWEKYWLHYFFVFSALDTM